MRQCRDIEEQLTAYLDGVLEAGEKESVEEHLSTCSHCLTAFKDLQRTREILARLDEVDPPSGLAEQIMSRIHEREERRKGLFAKLFFPLHIKIPVQALATILVVVLSVYIYKTTLPEMGNFERVPEPQVTGTGSPAAKKDISPKIPAAAPAPQRSSRKAQAEKKEPAPPPQTAAAPDIAPHDEKTFVPETHADDNNALSFSKAAPPPREERLKTRGTAVREEKSKAPEAQHIPPLPTGPRDVRSHIAMTAGNPGEAAGQAKMIMRSLGGTGIVERAEGNTAIVSGWIDTAVLGDLTDRLKEIAAVDESKSSFVSGMRTAFIEIHISGTDSGREEKPADR